jgi:hypothetical protein
MATLCSMATGVIQSYDRLNFGIYLQRIAEGIEIQGAVHQAIFKLELPTKFLLPPHIDDLTSSFRPDDSMLHFIRAYHKIHESLSIYLNDTLKSLDQIMPQEKQANRKTRFVCKYCEMGALAFFGGITGFSFLTSHHIAQLEDYMTRANELQVQTNKVFHAEITALSVIAEKENTRQQAVANLISSNRDFMVNLATQTERIRSSLTRETDVMMTLIEKLTEFSTQLNHLQEIRTALILLKHRKVTFDLVSPDTMQVAINNIQDNLENWNLRYRLIENTVTLAYQNQDNEFIRMGNFIYIIIKFHLSPIPTKLDLYKIHNVAFRFPSLETSDHAVQITNLANWILLPQQELDDTFLTFVNRPEITNKLLTLDQSQDFLRNLSEPSCVTVLLKNDLQGIKDECKIEVLFDRAVIPFQLIDTDMVFLNELDEFYIRCINDTEWSRHNASKLSRINIQPCCQFKAAGLILNSANMSCHEEKAGVDIIISTYAAPLHVLIHAFDLSEFDNLTADFIFLQQVNTSIPAIDLFQKDFAQKYSQMTKTSLEISKVLNTSRANEKIYLDLAHQRQHLDDIYIGEKILNTAGSLNLQTILVFTFPIITVGLGVLIYILFYRVRQLQAANLLINNPLGRLALRPLP